MKNTHDPADPIKKAPLRDPGQSLREELSDYIHDKILFWAVVGIAVVVLVFFEWSRWLFKVDVSPVAVTVGGAMVIAFCLWKFVKARGQLHNLKLGLKGERATGQYLQDELLRKGYSVFHDVCDDGFNIDHVVVGPGGVFSVETKTRSRSGGKKATVTYDGQKVLVDGFAPDRDPVVQAKASANRLREIILEHSGHDTKVRPVVLFPGWYVEKQPSGVETWVLNEKAFVKWVAKESKKLTIEQQRAMAEGIRRYVNARESA